MAARRRCAACGRTFKVLPQVPDQSYCPEPACQRERRKLWQRERRLADPDYRDNQAQAQQAWLGRNPDYWRDYRERHPEYAQANRARSADRSRERSRERSPEGSRERRDGKFAKMDVSSPPDATASLPPGLYLLRVIDGQAFAKMDTCFLVELKPAGQVK